MRGLRNHRRKIGLYLLLAHTSTFKPASSAGDFPPVTAPRAQRQAAPEQPRGKHCPSEGAVRGMNFAALHFFCSITGAVGRHWMPLGAERKGTARELLPPHGHPSALAAGSAPFPSRSLEAAQRRTPATAQPARARPPWLNAGRPAGRAYRPGPSGAAGSRHPGTRRCPGPLPLARPARQRPPTGD